ncbi:putative O-linked N-acetylglucosamine transferase (SPINDLY family) [Sphaerotilus hippei]|uniref:protein O-GlcNAc transferase n=1 Tax=Sphaerotilus hippei TaxID=744406 RepID=A0A318GYP2_9BURK|nr:tetratricopeptide repeat protein [Sphaerotilus hippei]PXW94981.1 putative O-linked N-acetylglucosamine transferase (SPINDLY family) [Sphaerotilus hippei]
MPETEPRTVAPTADDGPPLERAFALYQAQQFEAALPLARRAVELLPRRADAWTLLGILEKRHERLDAAEAAYRQALSLQPDYPDAWNNLGNLLRDRLQRDEALAAYRRAVELNPNGAEPTHNWAVALEHFGEWDAALAAFSRTVELDPGHVDGHWNRALALLLHGRHAEGFRDYEWRFTRRQPEPRVCAEPLWDGAPLQGRTILIWAEQGFGDALQCLRFVPEVVRRGGRVVLEVLQPMMALAERIPGVAAVTPRGGVLSPQAGTIDCHVALMSLPAVLQQHPGVPANAITAERFTLPRLAPSVHTPPERLHAWRERLLAHGWQPGTELAVGWVWAGNPNVRNDAWRSPRLDALAGLLEVEGVRWFALQKGPGRQDLDGRTMPACWVDLDAQIDDFADTAAVIAQLDLVITSDTSVAHLAGCLGKPVWVTLPWQRDWRYGMDATRSDWYPSMRLFRQPQRGDWPAVEQAVAAALHEQVRQRAGHTPVPLPPLDAQTRLVQAFEAFAAGQLETARSGCTDVLIGEPGRPDAWALLGAIHRRLGDADLAAEAYQRAIDVGPGFADAWRNLGLLRKAQGHHEEALRLLDAALSHAPLDRQAHSQRSDVLRLLGRHDEALLAADDTLLLEPHALEALIHRGNALVALGRLDEAVATYRAGLQHHPAALDLHYNLGIALQRAERPAEAEPHFEHVLSTTRQGVDLWNLARRPQGVPADATVHLHLRASYSLGLCLQTRGDLPAAAAEYRRLLTLDRQHFASRFNLAAIYLALGQHERALTEYEVCLDLQPGHVGVQLDVVHLRQQLCDWDRLPDAESQRALARACAEPPAGLDPPSPFALLSLPCALTDAELAPAARAHALHLMHKAGGPFAPPPARARAPGQRLRLAYASADFHNHATMHLMRGVFERHDRARFHISLYSWGPDDGSHYREQLLDNVDRFVDVAGWNESRIAERIRADDIDVLIDLKGYTRDSRPGVFVRRPAPLQLTWLGYPGAAGAPWFDAVIGDAVVTPESVAGAYVEPIARLPHSYQCTDHQQAIARTGLTRTACGLPEHATVIACFCTHYKLDPDTFALWMRLLKAVPTAWLWLIDGPALVRERLRAAATAAGVDARRLVFAPVWAKDRHLERLQLADLFLDTRVYNGHTTVSDALWAGVPVITRQGQAFAARVGASLLQAAGLPQGITRSDSDYEALALQLLRDRDLRQRWRDQLASRQRSAPLWNTAGFVRDLEALVTDLWQQRLEPNHAPELATP